MSSSEPVAFLVESARDRISCNGRLSSAAGAGVGGLNVTCHLPSTLVSFLNAAAGRTPRTHTSSIFVLSSQRSPLATTRFAQAPGLMEPHSFSMPRIVAGVVVIASMALTLSSPRAMALRICGTNSLGSARPAEVSAILTPALDNRPGFSGANSQCVSSSSSVSRAASGVATLGGFGKLTGRTIVR